MGKRKNSYRFTSLYFQQSRIVVSGRAKTPLSRRKPQIAAGYRLGRFLALPQSVAAPSIAQRACCLGSPGTILKRVPRQIGTSRFKCVSTPYSSVNSISPLVILSVLVPSTTTSLWGGIITPSMVKLSDEVCFASSSSIIMTLTDYEFL